QEDLYVYRLNNEDPTLYEYAGDYEKIQTFKERVPVRDGTEREVDLQFTRHGPVLALDAENNSAVALRAAWLEPGMVPYMGSLDLATAENWEQFCDRLQHWGAPGGNL